MALPVPYGLSPSKVESFKSCALAFRFSAIVLSGRTAAGPGTGRHALGAEDRRPRPAPLRGRGRRRARPARAASTSPGAAFCAGAACRAGSGARRARGRGSVGPPGGARLTRYVAPRRARRVRGGARALAQAGVLGGLRAFPLSRAHAGRDVPLQQARRRGAAPVELPVLPHPDGGRLGVGQEQAEPVASPVPRCTPRATSRSRSSVARGKSRC